jgi:hypothetical protein
MFGCQEKLKREEGKIKTHIVVTTFSFISLSFPWINSQLPTKHSDLGKQLVRSDRVQGGRGFWFNAYTKRRRFGKRGNPNLSQNGAVLVRALFIFFYFSLWEGIFVTWPYQNDVVLMFPSTFTAKTNGGG